MSEIEQASEDVRTSVASFAEAYDKMVEALVEVMQEFWRWVRRTMLRLWRFMIGYVWSARYPRLARIIRWVIWHLPEWAIWRVSLPRGFCV